MASLQDQLKQAGLINDKKAKQIQKDKRKQTKQAHKSKQVVVDETKQSAQAARAAKAERDRELNRQRQAEAEKKAIAAQIKQLIESNRQPKHEGREAELEYNFTDGKTIKKLVLGEQAHGRVTRGQLNIVKLGEGYELVPKMIADKIAERDAAYVLVANTVSAETQDEDDPYKDFVIPDDLMW
ncbi:DUF2058 domain-containing protein [Gilvimarinus agarilyticus]|uniref:DUF2058 domain-containing protein n=1 Tax=Gilvimarinus agarilyticus TaxID=679259 RepID=UPI0005A258BE|nr:DUF2058 domain-containing protein [Gilvimarinus agarilyticus]|tara:strand:- start:309 stop:857 length:549 start_codon:yes stop_codon:yes gene_type:complete